MSRDPTKQREYEHAYYQRNREFILAREREKYKHKRYRARLRAYHQKWENEHRKKVRGYAIAYLRRLKHESLVMYGGPICVCCGEQALEALSLEHINRDGAEARRNVLGPFYAWLRKHDYPQNLGLEVLCMNCQWGRRYNDGICYHEEGAA